MVDSHKESLASVRKRLAERAVTSREMVAAQIARIRKLNPSCYAYTRVFEEDALQAADRADILLAQGRLPGPLHGVPVAIKDSMDVAGYPTNCASQVRVGHVATRDAFVVRQLKAAGAVVVGKLNMTEFALSSYHPDLPVPVNPWGADHWSGASSSGSAVAVAMGLACGALGSDTGGSIRIPAAVNGVVGIKPTFGSVSKQGVFPLAYTLDHIGPVARRVEDAAILLSVLQMHDPEDPFSRRPNPVDVTSALQAGVDGLRIGIDEAYNAAHADSEVAAAVSRAGELLSVLGAEVVPVDIRGVLEVARYWGAIVAAESSLAHAETYPQQAESYGPVFRGLLESASRVTGAKLAQAAIAAARARQSFDSAFESVDMILCPGAPFPAMSLEDFPSTALFPRDVATSLVAYTAPMNFVGLPTVSVPCGFSKNRLPLGMQLVGRLDSEAILIQAAYTYEQAAGWVDRWPPMAS